MLMYVCAMNYIHTYSACGHARMSTSLLHGSLGVCRFTELDCLVDGHKHLLEDVKAGERHSIVLLRRGEVYIHVLLLACAAYTTFGSVVPPRGLQLVMSSRYSATVVMLLYLVRTCLNKLATLRYSLGDDKQENWGNCVDGSPE